MPTTENFWPVSGRMWKRTGRQVERNSRTISGNFPRRGFRSSFSSALIDTISSRATSSNKLSQIGIPCSPTLRRASIAWMTSRFPEGNRTLAFSLQQVSAVWSIRLLLNRRSGELGDGENRPSRALDCPWRENLHYKPLLKTKFIPVLVEDEPCETDGRQEEQNGHGHQ